MFYIKKLTISGNQVKESAVDFKKGLNIIYGPSQCGKTMVAECIDFILGAKNFPIDINSNYNCIKVVFSAGYRDISITRYANQNKVKVESQIDDIYSGIYPLDSKNSNSLNYLYLKLMGIYNPVQIYKSKDLVKQRLTYRTFSFLQIIKESVVHTKKSIFDNPEMKNTTALKAALIYLLSEQNYINDNDEDNKKKKTKKSIIPSLFLGTIGEFTTHQQDGTNTSLASCRFTLIYNNNNTSVLRQLYQFDKSLLCYGLRYID